MLKTIKIFNLINDYNLAGLVEVKSYKDSETRFATVVNRCHVDRILYLEMMDYSTHERNVNRHEGYPSKV